MITDNLPLKTIFDPNKNLPSTAALHPLRYALYLWQFDYQIQYRAAKNHTNVDFLSRKPTLVTPPDKSSPDEEICAATINQITLGATERTITHTAIKKATAEDPALAKLINELLTGKTQSVKYTIHNGILLRGCLLYTSPSPRDRTRSRMPSSA